MLSVYMTCKEMSWNCVLIGIMITLRQTITLIRVKVLLPIPKVPHWAIGVLYEAVFAARVRRTAL